MWGSSCVAESRCQVAKCVPLSGLSGAINIDRVGVVPGVVRCNLSLSGSQETCSFSNSCSPLKLSTFAQRWALFMHRAISSQGNLRVEPLNFEREQTAVQIQKLIQNFRKSNKQNVLKSACKSPLTPSILAWTGHAVHVPTVSAC